MKKILIILILAGAVFYVIKNGGPESSNTPADNSNFQPDPSSASFTIEGEEVTLSGGQSDNTELLETTGSGDLNNDGKADIVVLLAQSGGGSGVFIYAAAYISGPVAYRGTNAVFIGDRVSPQSASIVNGVATVRYLDRDEDEPMAAEPTIPATKVFIYRNGEFQER